MLACYTKQKDNHTIPVQLVLVDQFAEWQSHQTAFINNWLSSTQFKAEPGALRLIPNERGEIKKVLYCVTSLTNLWQIGALPFLLPENNYYFDLPNQDYTPLVIGWGLGAYQFTRYKKPQRASAQLFVPSSIDFEFVINLVESTYMVRDLINTPTDDLGPTQLAEITQTLTKEYGADYSEIIGDDLLSQNYPGIYIVGRASDDAPRLLDFRWGDRKYPLVTLVGKGICFDSGGLDIKPAAFMSNMKKDMGGAAHVLGLARMIMKANLPIQLRVLLPVAENVISGNAYRPGDVIKSRKGLTIEVGNTDAEGRVVLADALAEASTENPDLIIDISTLTGAARIALGPDLPVLFTNTQSLADTILPIGLQLNDPLWQLPLFAQYRDYNNSPIADLTNASSEPYAGAITAGLFLQEFVNPNIPWIHLDIMAWNTKTRPGRPQGGEAMGLRTLFQYLLERYSISH